MALIHRDLKRRGAQEDEDSSEEGEEESEEDSEEESEEEEEEGTPAQQELSRTERRELKKKQAAEKQKIAEEDPDFINPNHVEKKLNISDLSAPRELTRRERWASLSLGSKLLC